MERIEQTEFGSVFFEKIMIEAGELEHGIPSKFDEFQQKLSINKLHIDRLK